MIMQEIFSSLTLASGEVMGFLASAVPHSQNSAFWSNFRFWFAAAVFLVTFIAIASEKVHKTTAVGAEGLKIALLQSEGRAKTQRGSGGKDKTGFFHYVRLLL